MRSVTIVFTSIVIGFAVGALTFFTVMHDAPLYLTAILIKTFVGGGVGVAVALFAAFILNELWEKQIDPTAYRIVPVESESKNPNVEVRSPSAEKVPGPFLIVGVIVLPFVFSWIAMWPSYRRAFRIASFVWLLPYILLQFVMIFQAPKSFDAWIYVGPMIAYCVFWRRANRKST